MGVQKAGRLALAILGVFVFAAVSAAAETDVGYFNKAKGFYESQDLKTALSNINRAIGQNPSVSAYFILRGNIRTKMYQKPEALADYSSALKLDPKNKALKKYLRDNKNSTPSGSKDYKRRYGSEDYPLVMFGPEGGAGFFFGGNRLSVAQDVGFPLTVFVDRPVHSVEVLLGFRFAASVTVAQDFLFTMVYFPVTYKYNVWLSMTTDFFFGGGLGLCSVSYVSSRKLTLSNDVNGVNLSAVVGFNFIYQLDGCLFRSLTQYLRPQIAVDLPISSAVPVGKFIVSISLSAGFPFF